ncbi:hypothetical protein GT348_04205 [Aristophania vespae]|uniref:Uncharacterized protein n=1 Tax=Aristophania vespae TaxID=2697033 RepID=A0A6P1NB09_9PROT|nr:hypothetical protein [Aristophania vespae]QHI95505.1 hypothetical protein GT348_03795 [Aristophania vespae]QHI95576.1 hypothetical protein GT348_04205 [Aristophania vespae]UMM63237.1 hypothetical protein DM15PD_01950 [Aristophania vespae]
MANPGGSMSYSVISSGFSPLERYSSQFYDAPANLFSYYVTIYIKTRIYFRTKKEVLERRYGRGAISLFRFLRKSDIIPHSSFSTHGCKMASHFTKLAVQAISAGSFGVWQDSYRRLYFSKIFEPFKAYEQKKMMKGIS